MRIFLAFVLFISLLKGEAQASIESPTIHVIGDSHSRELMFIPGCLIHYIGSVTMHRVGRDGIAGLNLKGFGVNDYDVVVFAFGEIDVRCHMGKQRDQFNRNEDEVINTLAANFLCTILQNKLEYKNLTCVVYSVTPPTDQTYNPTWPFMAP